MRKRLAMSLFAIGLAATPAAANQYGDRSAPLTTVQNLDLGRYAGLWYEIARYPNRFERNCVAVTAEYTPRDDGTIGVRNSCRKESFDGRLEVAEGSARVEGPGQLSVNFVRFLPFIRGDYYVLDVAADYSLAVVGTPDRNYGWVLARASHISDADWQHAQEVLTRNGYRLDALERVPQP